jgi:predicted phosphohydrolase
MKRISATIRRLFYLSDTHLEHRVRPVPHSAQLTESAQPEGKTAMALLGDIGWTHEESYWDFVRQCSGLYDYVLILLGNHEYYNNYIQELPTEFRQELHRRCLSNVYFLENETLEFDNVVFWGSTLWTRPSWDIFQIMNDRAFIRDKSTPNQQLSISTIHTMHHRAVQSLRQELAAPIPQKPYVLLTHHGPLAECNGTAFHHSKRISAYVNQLDEHFRPPVVAWLYGHTHQNMTFHKNNILVSTNAFGYPRERLTVPFDPERFIQL